MSIDMDVVDFSLYDAILYMLYAVTLAGKNISNSLPYIIKGMLAVKRGSYYLYSILST